MVNLKPCHLLLKCQQNSDAKFRLSDRKKYLINLDVKANCKERLTSIAWDEMQFIENTVGLS